MSEPPLRKTHTSSDVTPLGHAALLELALRVLEHHSGGEAGAQVLAAAAQRAYKELAHVSTPLIGQGGVDALVRRAVHLAQRDHPWLVAAPESDDTSEPFGQVIASVERQNPGVATEGTASVFATFAGLLVTFIGERLTMSLLRKAWPDAFAAVQTKEKET